MRSGQEINPHPLALPLMSVSHNPPAKGSWKNSEAATSIANFTSASNLYSAAPERPLKPLLLGLASVASVLDGIHQALEALVVILQSVVAPVPKRVATVHI